MPLITLEGDALRLILFGGKGGVGKTTCASGAGLYLAKQRTDTLVISTDPAHSLSDSLGQEIGKETKRVRENLSALEISAEKALAEFKIEYGNEVRKILDTATYLDQEDIDSVFALPIPGIDEVMGFKTILDLIEEGKFKKYIVDTAPTGHALRLLTFPQLLDEWIKVLAKMRWKYRYMVTSFAGKYSPDEADEFLMEMKKTVKRIEDLLRDEKRCEFIPVTIPETMAILETERLVDNLGKHGMMVKQLVINNVLEARGCEFCKQRGKEQEKYIKQIRKRFRHLRVTIVPLQAREVKGLDALDSFKELLFG